MTKNYPKTVYMQEGVRYHNVCCEKLQKDMDIQYQDKRWQLFCEGVHKADIIHCLYCGKKLEELL